MKILKLREPIAKKEHKCMLCGGVINKGEQYKRQTCIYNGSIYDLVCHSHCSFLASKLDMYDYCDNKGLDNKHFSEMIADYMHDNHYDELINKMFYIWENKNENFIYKDNKKSLKEYCDMVIPTWKSELKKLL